MAHDVRRVLLNFDFCIDRNLFELGHVALDSHVDGFWLHEIRNKASIEHRVFNTWIFDGLSSRRAPI